MDPAKKYLLLLAAYYGQVWPDELANLSEPDMRRVVMEGINPNLPQNILDYVNGPEFQDALNKKLSGFYSI